MAQDPNLNNWAFLVSSEKGGLQGKTERTPLYHAELLHAQGRLFTLPKFLHNHVLG